MLRKAYVTQIFTSVVISEYAQNYGIKSNDIIAYTLRRVGVVQ